MSLYQAKRGSWVLRYYENGTKAGPRVREVLPPGTTREQAEDVHRLRVRQRGDSNRRVLQLEVLRDRGEDRTALIGGIAELWVAADLMAKGFHVFRHVVVQSPCDLVLMHGRLLLRIECKMRQAGMKGPGIRPNSERFDVLAVVDPRSSEIRYYPDIYRAIAFARQDAELRGDLVTTDPENQAQQA